MMLTGIGEVLAQALYKFLVAQTGSEQAACPGLGISDATANRLIELRLIVHGGISLQKNVSPRVYEQRDVRLGLPRPE